MSLDHALPIVKHQTPTRDAFLGSRLHIAQPATGFRAGTDSVLLGAAIDPGARRLLDLGCGTGVAALVALAHNPHLAATLVDNNAEMLALAASNLAANDFAGRAATLDLDIAARGAVRAGAGLATDRFDAVIANPPFFAGGRGTLPADAARADARHMADTMLDLWVRTAAASAAPGGEIIFVHRAESLPALLAAFDARFGAIAVLPVVSRPGEVASRVLVRARKGSRAPLRLLSPLVLHELQGHGFAPAVDAIFRGAARLVW